MQRYNLFRFYDRLAVCFFSHVTQPKQVLSIFRENQIDILTMKKSILLITAFFCFVNMKCSEDDPLVVDSENLLIGTWINPKYDNEQIIFKRSSVLPDEAYGISFNTDGEFTERTSGWCGTPPLAFFDVEGSWNLGGTLITISQDNFPNTYTWRIISLTESELIVERELTDQEKDHQELMALFNEIYNLSLSVSCEDAKDWTFSAYGSKACGGPQGFIAYSTKIDVEAFLDKVETYTALENTYNIKWGIISTCDLPQQPKVVECQNGYPVLNY